MGMMQEVAAEVDALRAEVKRLKTPDTTTIQEVLRPWVAVAKAAQHVKDISYGKEPADVLALFDALAHPDVQKALSK